MVGFFLLIQSEVKWKIKKKEDDDGDDDEKRPFGFMSMYNAKNNHNKSSSSAVGSKNNQVEPIHSSIVQFHFEPIESQ